MSRTPSPPPPRLVAATILLLCSAVALAADSDALLAFKSTLSPTPALQDWTPGSKPCNGDHNNWPGVICVNGTIYGLQLENMSLTGEINLESLESIRSLRTLSMMHNNLTGPMPDVGRLPALKSVYLAWNQLSGPIPANTFRNMRKLKRVYLSHNQFSGPIPASLTASGNLMELRLDGNRFDGRIPEFRQRGLRVINVSGNRLEGPIPEGLKKMNAAWFSGNELLCGKPLNVECEPTTNLPPKKNPSHILLIIILVIIVIILLLLALIVVRRRQGEPVEQLGRPASTKTKNFDPSAAEKMEQGSSDYSSVSSKKSKESESRTLIFVKESRERFELQDLLKASAEVLGSGNFGSSYKAILVQGPSVVVKRFKEMNGVGREDFQEHMRRLGRLSHPNLLPLTAYYYRKEEKLLITEYIFNGSLAHMLHGSSLAPLDWPTRLKIVKGVARGLVYLYDELPMLSIPHGHLKSSNVLLNETFEPLLSDYALIPVMNQSSAAQIMVAYKSPEVTKTGKISKKSDVWSFGILILEILTGKFPANYLQKGKGSTDFAGWVNSVVKEEWTGEVFDSELKVPKNAEEEMLKLLHIGLSCCEADVEKRMEMNDVLDKIEELKDHVGEEESSSFVNEEL